MNLPNKQQIQDKINEFKRDHGTIASKDFKKGVEWILSKLSKTN